MKNKQILKKQTKTAKLNRTETTAAPARAAFNFDKFLQLQKFFKEPKINFEEFHMNTTDTTEIRAYNRKYARYYNAVS